MESVELSKLALDLQFQDNKHKELKFCNFESFLAFIKANTLVGHRKSSNSACLELES